jgi:hypothetical protein
VQCADFAHTLSRRVPAFLETDALRLCRGSASRGVWSVPTRRSLAGAVWYNSSRRGAAGLRVKKPTSSRHPKRQTTSRTGGAATGRGVEYQTQYSVYRALLLLQDGLCIPDAHATIGIEPRVPSSGALTAWDTLVSGGAVVEELIEAKASPKHVRCGGMAESRGARKSGASRSHISVCVREGNALVAVARPTDPDSG